MTKYPQQDFFASSTYTYRWHNIATALKAQFPNIYFITTLNTFNPVLSPNPTEYNVHVYQTPTWFAQNSFFYDIFQRNGTKYFKGEYAAISTNANNLFGSPADGRLTFLTMQSAAGKAVFMTGLERNSDIVFAASYVPLLGHVTNNQWTPNLLAFKASSVYCSTRFYIQKLFSVNCGDVYLPTSTETAQILTGTGTVSNTPTSPNLLVPVTSTITTGKNFNFNASPVSVSVLTFTAS
ncbi:alpha-L-arabinofuranosidase C-terminus-domain-containing protein [Crassisporium funariophilum]|nr:alpha-L-arabinofuranosidase C-terminus-domain-containing protein [Crassisporium funariophilum]